MVQFFANHVPRAFVTLVQRQGWSRGTKRLGTLWERDRFSAPYNLVPGVFVDAADDDNELYFSVTSSS